jgi:hypothetical protein
MAFTTVFILLPFALFASSVLFHLFYVKYNFLDGITSSAIKKCLKLIVYFIGILISTYIIILISMLLLMGIIGIPVLIILDIVLIKKIIKKNTYMNNRK